MTDFDNIPDELKERSQWLLWSHTSKPPKAPLGKEGYPIDRTDPVNWLSFDEARQLCESDDSFDGVGFVIVESDPYIGLDLDGILEVANEERPKDWVPGLGFIAATWAEYSGSGTGIHVFSKGEKLPEWWTDCHFSDAEHEGVEAYTDWFFALTGDTVDFANNEITEIDIEPFLSEAYETIKGEPPRLPGKESKPDSDIEIGIYDVISRGSYPEGENTGHPFHPSDTGTNFRVDEGGETFRCWRHSVTGNGAHLLGIEQGIIDCGDWANGGLSSDTWKQIFDAGRAAGYQIPQVKKTDGGATTVTPRSSKSSESGLTIDAIIEKAGYNPNDTELIEVKGRELGHAIAELIAEVDDYHFLWSENLDGDEPIMWGYSDGLWNENGLTQLRIMTREVLGPRNTKQLMNKIKHSFTGMPEAQITPDEMGAPPETIPVKNGLLHLREHGIEGSALSELQPEHRAIRKLPTAYDPEADYQDTLFYELVRENVRDETDLKRLQEYAGYTLWHHDQPFGKALFLIGPTDSGKGLFLKILKGVLGKENISAETMENLMESRWGFAQLYGNVANIRNEVTAGGLSNVQRFKELTGGGDRVTAEYKNGRKFKFDVTQKFLFATNQIPSIKHAGDPFFNRLLFVQFPETVPEREQIKDAKDRILENEQSAVLNWMLDGLNRLMDQGYFTGERSIKEKKNISNSWGGLMDRFIHNVIEITGDPNDVVHKKQLFGLFDAHAEWVGQDNNLQQQTFTKELKSNAGVSDGQTSRLDPEEGKVRVFKGIRLKNEAIDELDIDEPLNATGEKDENGSNESKQARF